ncbi:MAG: hypothetical protein V1826_02190 [bacterium]
MARRENKGNGKSDQDNEQGGVVAVAEVGTVQLSSEPSHNGFHDELLVATTTVDPAEGLELPAEADWTDGIISEIDLDSLIAETNKLINVAGPTRTEIDKMANRYPEVLGGIEQASAQCDEMIAAAKRELSLPGNLSPDQLDELASLALINPDYAQKIQTIDSAIAKLKNLAEPTIETGDKLTQLNNVRAGIRAGIEQTISRRRDELAAELEKRIKEIEAATAESAAALINELRQLEANPRVMARLEEMRIEQARQAQLEKELAQKEVLKIAQRFSQSLRNRYAAVAARIAEITGRQALSSANEWLWQVTAETDEQRQQRGEFLKGVKNELVDSILDGESLQQVREPREVVPWLTSAKAIRYGEAYNYLTNRDVQQALAELAEAGSQQAAEVLSDWSCIQEFHDAFDFMFGRKYFTDPRTKERRPDRFWAAFEQRQHNDASGETKRRQERKACHAAETAKLEIEIGDVVSRGGFEVEVPVTRRNRSGQIEVVAVRRGAVRVKKRPGVALSTVLVIVEAVGAASEHRILGQTSPEDGRSFPQWVRVGLCRAEWA